ncbi:RDD family protein [Nitrospirillum sp. BR 11828]|uniref:RDD family protein n=1 Tax=Nitrospirillum sp. BR 11828 TaxID=3104325 RepID=UPI002ACA6CC8|nr:RDD family protein [Nitrospirillum sp. BR 11828]MDZ5649092.1 RDD family protein [Nitrospirillum sp. BR 11828]
MMSIMQTGALAPIIQSATEDALTPTPHGGYAGFWTRAIATWVDFLIYLVVSVIFAAFTAIVIHLISPNKHLKDFVMLSILLTILFMAARVAYETAFCASTWRATPGKRAQRLFVGNRDTGRLTSRAAFMRGLAKLAFNAPPIILGRMDEVAAQHPLLMLATFVPMGMNYGMALVTREKAAGHDLLCGTRVFRRPPLP